MRVQKKSKRWVWWVKLQSSCTALIIPYKAVKEEMQSQEQVPSVQAKIRDFKGWTLVTAGFRAVSYRARRAQRWKSSRIVQCHITTTIEINSPPETQGMSFPKQAKETLQGYLEQILQPLIRKLTEPIGYSCVLKVSNAKSGRAWTCTASRRNAGNVMEKDIYGQAESRPFKNK